jgi:sulfur carrier protein
LTAVTAVKPSSVGLQLRLAGRIIRTMQVQLSHPARTVDVKGPKRAKDVLRELNLVVEAHLVIRGDELVTEDEMLLDKDQIEIRPVISGGM